MERLNTLCIERLATLSGTNTSTVRSMSVYLHLCHNLSSTIYIKRQKMNVLDFAETYPLDIAIPVLGYASPIVIFVTIILNFCVIKVLSSKKLRSPTNIILVAIAVLDMVTGSLRLPWYIHTYSLHGYQHLPDQFWCHSYYYLFLKTPAIIHTASLWCTVLLAFQRYVGISQLRQIGCVCQYRGLIAFFVTIGVGSFIIHSFELILVKLDPVRVISNDFINLKGQMAYTNTCAKAYREAHFRVYSKYYGWIRLVLAQILPCVFLGVFNMMLIRITFKGYKYRRRLVRGNKAAQNRELRTTLRMSVMLILITGSTLLAETIVAILIVIQTALTHLVLEPTLLSKFIVISNFFILITFPLNFLFYFLMSRRFRRHFVNCYVQRKRRRVVPLLGPTKNANNGAGENDVGDDDDEDDEDDDVEEPVSPVPMMNFNRREEFTSSKCSSQIM